MSSSDQPGIGSLLLAPADSGPRASDVLCAFDEDSSEPGVLFAVVLNRPTDQPAQPLAFGLFDCHGDHAWWGGPTHEVFALVELTHKNNGDDEYLPESDEPRRYVTSRTGIWLPGRDHRPSTPHRARVLIGSIWLSPEAAELYRSKGVILTATDDVLFDADPATLADRFRSRDTPVN